MSFHRIALGASLVASAVVSAQTQPSITTAPAEHAAVAIAPTQPATTQATTQAAAPTTQEIAKQRLAKFLQLKFDRRLPTALAAMAATQPSEEEQQFVADVAAGRWNAVAKVISSFDEQSAQQLHRQLLQSLVQGAQPDGGPQRPGQPRVMIQRGGGGQDPNAMFAVLLPDDVLALSDAATTAPEEQDVNLLGQLLVRSFARGAITDGLVARLEAGTRHFGGPATDQPKRTKAAELLFAAQKSIEAGPFLPPLDTALAAKDAKTLDLHARHLAAVGAEPKETAALRKSWDVTQAILAIDTAPGDLRDAAVQRALDLMPQLTKQLGIEWLKKSFTDPLKGRAVVAGIGSDVAGNFMNMQVEERTKALTHQRQAVDQLAAVAGPQLEHWAPALNLMALTWLQEAEYTKPRPSQKEMNQGPRYDRYGNYMGSGGMQRNNNEPPPVDAQVLLKSAPSDAWIATLDASLAPRIRASIIEMHLKNEDPDAALPLIESLAKTQPKVGLVLSNQLLGVWAKVRNPNEGQQNYNSYGGSFSPYGYAPYGSGSPSNALPLTRTAQVRNLTELHALLDRLKTIRPGKQALDDEAVVKAFTSAHSDAEVYRTEDIESAFGPVEAIPIDTLAQLLQSMRERLARQWRQLAVQQQAKTKRTDKDVDAEMTRGYELLVSMIQKRLATDADWRLQATLGSALFDWAEFDYGNQVELAVYTKRRDRSFESFAKAAQLYAGALPKLEEKDETVTVYQQWFNAALGASDLAQLTRQQAPSASQLEQIKQALTGLQPADLRERHVERFGQGLSESVQSLKPELKPRYLRAGVQIVGNHPSADEARKLVKYYDDLLTEVALYAQVDGDAVVGHAKPFGLNIGIRHTVTVGRESGGFAKYLQNQQSGRGYYYGGYSGSGGPKNYRDDFEKKIREALVEGFDIISITYHDETIQPRGYGRPGWRETPLAYVLLRAKDASVDKVPPIQMDMDFTDRHGQVVLPVTSQVLLVDARPDTVAPRPITKLAIVQTLDEREAKNGKLTLDIKATASGLLPDLPELLDTSIPGFRVEKVDDQGLSVTKMDAEGDTIAPACERSWIVSLAAAPGAKDAMTFRFPPSKVQGAQTSYKRYSDADVVDVEPSIAIGGIALMKRAWWPLAACGFAVLVALVVAVIWWRRRHPPRVEVAHAYAVPHALNAFSVLQLLRTMHRDDRLAAHRPELASAIEGLEQTYFAPTNGNGNGSPDLAQVAQQWIARTR